MAHSPPPTNYAALCMDPRTMGLGPPAIYHDHIRDVYSRWSLDVMTPLDADDLFKEILFDLGSSKMVGGVLSFVATTAHPEGVARVVHNIREFRGSGQHRKTTFGYVGDVHEFDIEVVKFTKNVLNAVGPVSVHSDIDAHMAQLNAIVPGDPKLAGPYDHVLDPATYDEIETRGGMYLPATLIPYVIGDENLPSGKAVEVLMAAMRAQNLEAVCEDLIQYLKYVSTYRQPAVIGGASRYPDSVQAKAGDAFGGGRDVYLNRRQEILYVQLPTLALASTGSDPMERVVAPLNEIRDAHLAAVHDARVHRAGVHARKTVAQKWNDRTVDRICRMCQEADTDDLPPLYSEWAAMKKTDGTLRALLQDAVESAATTLHIPHCPTVTVQHATALNGWVFCGAGDQSLGEGLMPFSVVPPNQVSVGAVAAIQAAHNQNMDYNTVMTGSTSITSEDAQKLRSAKGYIPSNFEEMIVQLQSYACLLGAILGTGHPNVVEHLGAVNTLIVNQALLKQFVSAEHGVKLGAATIVYYFHLRHRNWFTEQWKLTTLTSLPPPSLKAGFDTFASSYTTTWLPKTSHVDLLQRLARPPATQVRPPAAQAPAPSAAPRAASTGGGNGATSTRTSTTERVRVSNRNRDPRFMGETPLARKIRSCLIADALDRAGDPPQTSSNTPRCLSWHLKGKCFDQCPRTDDHVVLPTEDADTLHEWCQRAYP